MSMSSMLVRSDRSMELNDRDERNDCPQDEVDPIPGAEIEVNICTCNEVELGVTSSPL